LLIATNLVGLYRGEESGRMRNPRRDAIEYGILVTLTTVMAGAYGVILYLGMTPDENGNPRKKMKVDLNEPVDIGATLRALRSGDLFGSGKGGKDDK